jgi:branched-chain amino acid transport system ATP-binding protein
MTQSKNLMAILEIKNVTKQFGGLTALNDVSFQVEEGEIRGLIGPNGAGKSTMFKNIAGFSVPTKGSIIYRGKNIEGKKPHTIAEMGIVRTFQETTLFQEMSVFENALVGSHIKGQTDIFSAVFGLGRQKQETAVDKVMEVLEFMGLSERKNQLASELPLGSQRALALSIALVSEPKVMLMDEPFAGMDPKETNRMMDLTRKVQESGVTIILVEHDMKAVMGLSHYLTVLNFGQVLAEGTPEDIRNNEKVIEAYLGGAK